MKLLFDENLSHKLLPLITASFPASQHVREVGNCTRDDLLNLIRKHERDILAFETSAESVLILS
jgi:hypothetical protein